MIMRFDINKRLVAYLLEEITDKDLPINCTTGKTYKESEDYMIDVTFVYDDDVQPIFSELLNKCINDNML